jgi:hypothetical protein
MCEVLFLKASPKVLLVYVHLMSLFGRGRVAAMAGVQGFLLMSFV